MTDQQPSNESIFRRNLPSDFVLGSDAAQQRLLREYGAVFVARGGVLAPNRVVFRDERDVAAFQSQMDIAIRTIGDYSLELQARAMDKLLEAISDAGAEGLSITPRGADSARRNYDETIELWKSRVEPALVHWVQQGRMTPEQADIIRGLTAYEQVPEVFALEENGIFFAKDLSKSIIYSVAPPGASQHLSLLAFDVTQHNDARVRKILARQFWYQTVVSDLPHFTFLGVSED
ncbi:MAG: hypothetical protein ABI857_11060, partial [Acidobacteriota bacterium]